MKNGAYANLYPPVSDALRYPEGTRVLYTAEGITAFQFMKYVTSIAVKCQARVNQKAFILVNSDYPMTATWAVRLTVMKSGIARKMRGRKTGQKNKPKGTL